MASTTRQSVEDQILKHLSAGAGGLPDLRDLEKEVSKALESEVRGQGRADKPQESSSVAESTSRLSYGLLARGQNTIQRSPIWEEALTEKN